MYIFFQPQFIKENPLKHIQTHFHRFTWRFYFHTWRLTGAGEVGPEPGVPFRAVGMRDVEPPLVPLLLDAGPVLLDGVMRCVPSILSSDTSLPARLGGRLPWRLPGRLPGVAPARLVGRLGGRLAGREPDGG